jgi:sec-independent protein translocase protein TatA
MPNVGPLELIIVAIIALIVFGPKRLPELGKSLGRGIREFRGAVTGKDDDDDEEMRELESAQAEAHAETAEAVEGEVVTEKRA